MANTYQPLIDELLNGIPDDTGVLFFKGVNSEGDEKSNIRIYLSVYGLLRFIEYDTLIFIDKNPLINIDYEDKPCLALSSQVSSDLRICYIYRTDANLSTVNSYHPTNKFRDFFGLSGSLADINIDLAAKSNASSIPLGQIAVYPQVGNINNIYLDINYLSTIISEKIKSNSDGKISLMDFLQKICTDTNRALGDINDFQPYLDSDNNILTILDLNQKRIKGLPLTFQPSGSQVTDITMNGMGTFITNISVESAITSDIASMISIGAQANGNVLGEEATTFSKLSYGLEDRIQPIKTFSPDSSKNFSSTSNNPIDALQENIKSYVNNILKPQLGNAFTTTPISLTDDDFEKGSIIVDINKYFIGYFTNSNVIGSTFIPIKMSLDMLGLSGVKIFQKFKTTSNILPYDYRDNFEFIITGVEHTINNENYWNTSITALIALADKNIDSALVNLQAFDLESAANIVIMGCRAKTINFETKNPSITLPISNPLSPEIMKKAWNYAFTGVSGDNGVWTGKTHQCAEGTLGLANNYMAFYNSPIITPTGLAGYKKPKIAAGGPAKSLEYRNKLVALGYGAPQLVGEGLSRQDMSSTIDSMTFNLGDILIYYSEDSTSDEGEYGHTQMYVGNLISSKWSSDIKNNYNGSFVYRSKTSNCWTLYVVRAPQK